MQPRASAESSGADRLLMSITLEELYYALYCTSESVTEFRIWVSTFVYIAVFSSSCSRMTQCSLMRSLVEPTLR